MIGEVTFELQDAHVLRAAAGESVDNSMNELLIAGLGEIGGGTSLPHASFPS